MQSGSRVMLDNGRLIALGKLVKSGGAGSVYLLPDDPGRVAKVYHPHVDRADYERKLQAMLRLSPDLPEGMDGDERLVQIAWPSSLARDERGRFVGFLMPKLDIQATIELEYMLQERQARAAGLPTGLGARMTLAANLSAVLAELHRQQHYVVDLKPVNVRFYRRSLNLAMLDCDGFSIRGPSGRFPAQQYTPEYLAPEFHAAGIDLHGEEQQDRFALAVIVFQLLNFGIHPYTGRPETDAVPTDIPGRIAGRWYAYGLQENKRFKPNPGSGHEQMPLELRLLFDRAFADAGPLRPTPAEWATVLKPYAMKAAGRLTNCARDATHQHFASHPCAACARALLLQAAAPAKVPAAHRTQAVTQPSPLPTPRRKRGKKRKRGGTTPPTPLSPSSPLPISATTLAALPAIAQIAHARQQRRATAHSAPTNRLLVWGLSILMGVLLLALYVGPYVNPSPYSTESTSAAESFAASNASNEVRLEDVLRAAASGHGPLYERHMASFRARSAALVVRRSDEFWKAKQRYSKLAGSIGSRQQPDYVAKAMGLLATAHRLQPHDSTVVSELGFMQLLYFGLEPPASIAAEHASVEGLLMLPPVHEVFEHGVASKPDDSGHWYGLALSHVDIADARLAIGAFAISELLASRSGDFQFGRSRLRLAERSLGGARKERLEILKARGQVAAAALGAPVPPEAVQLLGAKPLPPAPLAMPGHH